MYKLWDNRKIKLLSRARAQIVYVLVLATFFMFSILSPGPRVMAQDQQPDGPVYIVQEGDSLWDIAVRFGVSMQDLQSANGITDPNQLTLGASLTIPGLAGVQGVLITQRVGLGESVQSISRRLGVPVEMLARLNHLISPAELYAGATLVVPQKEDIGVATRRAMLAPGQSILELAVLENTNPWDVLRANSLDGQAEIVPGEVYHLPAGAEVIDINTPGALPAAIENIQLRPERLIQGQAAEIIIEGQPGMVLSGALAGRDLNFFEDGPGQTSGMVRYVALQGVHAMLEPGLYPVSLAGSLPNGTNFSFSQGVFVVGGGYPFDPVLIVSPETIDPSVTQPEDAQWMALVEPATLERLWQGKFESPAPAPYSDCYPSIYGSRRSYNGSAYSYFHTGLDFCGGVGTQILAPAAGIVVFAGPLTVRGNATMIDHGWGVYSAYMHQSEILVEVGDRVNPGQVIGLVGGTGRVTGPHLHFEIFVGGVQVDPQVWLAESYP